jgi:hypothetical protein
MSILILNKKEFVHLTEKSSYNNNYYKNTKRNFEIFEECDEAYNSFDFYLVQGKSEVYLGNANESVLEEIEEKPTLEIDFQRIG